jgi:hypothetical protein
VITVLFAAKQGALCAARAGASTGPNLLYTPRVKADSVAVPSVPLVMPFAAARHTNRWRSITVCIKSAFGRAPAVR